MLNPCTHTHTHTHAHTLLSVNIDAQWLPMNPVQPEQERHWALSDLVGNTPPRTKRRSVLWAPRLSLSVLQAACLLSGLHSFLYPCPVTEELTFTFLWLLNHLIFLKVSTNSDKCTGGPCHLTMAWGHRQRACLLAASTHLCDLIVSSMPKYCLKDGQLYI